MGSSLPRHGARVRTRHKDQKKKKKNKKKKTKGRLQVSTKKKYRTKIYMMHEQIKCYDACPNAMKLSSSSQNWLKHKVSNKNPKNLKKHLFLNNWTLEGDTAGVEGTLLALVFLGMVLE